MAGPEPDFRPITRAGWLGICRTRSWHDDKGPFVVPSNNDWIRYQTFRSVSDVHVFVLCYDGTFYERVPADVRKQGPWQGHRLGDVDASMPSTAWRSLATATCW